MDKKVYTEKLALKLKEWDVKIDEIRTRAETAGKEAKLIYKQQLLDLKERREKAAKLLEQIHESGDRAWGDVRKKADAIIDDVKKILKKAA